MNGDRVSSMSRFRRWGRIILRVAGAAAVIGMGLWVLWRDEPPPADADLRNYRRDVKDEENGFRLLDLTDNDIVWPQDVEGEDLVNGNSGAFDREKAAEIATSNAWWIRNIDRALGRREFQVDVLDDTEFLVPSLLGRRRMAHVLTSRSRLHIEEGRPEEAYEDAMRIIRLGGRWQRAQGTLIEFLVGAAIQDLGAHRLVHMAVHGQLPVQVLRRGIKELEPEVRRNGLADSLKAEYVYISSGFDRYVEGTLPHPQFAPGPRFFLKPGRTRRLLAEKIRALIECDGAPPASRKPLDLSDLTSSSWEVFVLRNAGSVALAEFLPSFESALKQADLAHAGLAATRILLALMAHRAEKGALPDSLEALVPSHLDAVPLDPYTKKEFRYSPAKRILYSAGADGFDAGGSTEEAAGAAFADCDEPTLRLDPAAWKLYTPEDEEPSDDGGEE